MVGHADGPKCAPLTVPPFGQRGLDSFGMPASVSHDPGDSAQPVRIGPAPPRIIAQPVEQRPDKPSTQVRDLVIRPEGKDKTMGKTMHGMMPKCRNRLIFKTDGTVPENSTHADCEGFYPSYPTVFGGGFTDMQCTCICHRLHTDKERCMAVAKYWADRANYAKAAEWEKKAGVKPQRTAP